MATVFDYLKWRGDLSFAQDPLNPVDGLIFCALSYIPFVGQAAETPNEPIALRDAAADFLSLDDYESRVRAKNDAMMLRAAAETARFGGCKMVLYRDQFVPEEETQFAAMTFLLPDDTAFVAFRGTDRSLVGWKEDFNMAFQEAVPAQLLAQDYVREVAAEYVMPLRLGGHSKGGNLAVYGGIFVPLAIQRRISAVWSNDGPGFYGAVLETPQHARLERRIHSIVPKSSVVGMLLEHEESYTVVDSDQTGLWQHDGFSWQVLGAGFVTLRQVSRQGRRNDLALKEWVRRLPVDQREKFVDGLFEVLTASGATTLTDLKEDGFRAAGAMVRAMKDMEKDTRDALFNAIATLFRSNIQAAVEEAREEARSEGSPLRKLTELTEKIVGKE